MMATADYDSTVANYRQTTLSAFQQVEDNLAALRILEVEARQQHESTDSAEQSLDLSQTRYEGGSRYLSPSHHLANRCAEQRAK
jgi:outer membrane protein TolC